MRTLRPLCAAAEVRSFRCRSLRRITTATDGGRGQPGHPTVPTSIRTEAGMRLLIGATTVTAIGSVRGGPPYGGNMRAVRLPNTLVPAGVHVVCGSCTLPVGSFVDGAGR